MPDLIIGHMGVANRREEEIQAEVVSSCMLLYTTEYFSLRTLLRVSAEGKEQCDVFYERHTATFSSFSPSVLRFIVKITHSRQKQRTQNVLT